MHFVRVVTAAIGLCVAAYALAQESAISRGEYLIHAGGCIDCHTDEHDGAIRLAGGRALESPFGTFYSPNITPDVETGIGAFSDEDFLNAFWEGVNPEGENYYPTFPYPSYTGIQREDLLAMKAYLFSIEPVRQAAPEHKLPWYLSTRRAVGVWKRRYFEAARFSPLADRSDQWNRGAYLVRHLGHCGECHTPRNRLGAIRKDRELAGNPNTPDGEVIPNITPHRIDGIGNWTADDIEYFLDIGMFPDGDFVGSTMSAVVENNTSRLTRDDRLAIATYLKSIPPQPSVK